MRQDQAERLAAQIEEEAPASSVAVLHVDAAPEPYGFVVMVDGRRISSPSSWTTIAHTMDRQEPRRITLRIPEELAARVEGRAGQNRRSLNAEIVMALDRWVADT